MRKEKCFICLREAKKKCSSCSNNVWYCGEDHLKLHKDVKNGNECFPFKIIFVEGVGRCMKASRFIHAGEVIYKELPVVEAPNAISRPQCLFCCKKVSGDDRCLNCNYPICGSKELCCEAKENFHKSFECAILKELHSGKLPDFQNDFSLTSNTIYEPIAAIRLLLLKEWNKSGFAYVHSLMDHRKGRMINKDFWDQNMKSVILPIVAAFKEKLSLEDVIKAVGIIEVNNYEIHNPDKDAGNRGVFPITSMMSHNCRPNCRPVIQKTWPFENQCVATVDIESGEDLNITYVDLLQPTKQRRKILKENWYFDCCCQRCADPTELGCFVGAIKCLTCLGKLCLPINPLDQESVWECQECKTQYSAQSISKILSDCEAQKEKIPKLDIKAQLRLLSNLEDSLSENHFLLNGIRRWIIPFLCRKSIYDAEADLSLESLARKIKICKQYLRYLDLIDRGFSKTRGKVLYELAEASLNENCHYYHEGQMDQFVMIKKLDECISLLRESRQCLLLEDKISFEGKIQVASGELLSQVISFKDILLDLKG